MKFLVVLAVMVAAAVAAPPTTGDREASILAQEDIPNVGDGSFQNGFESSNGIAAQAQGALKNVGLENEAQTVTGSFRWIENGVEYVLTYVADENGYQPSANFLPQPVKA